VCVVADPNGKQRMKMPELSFFHCADSCVSIEMERTSFLRKRDAINHWRYYRNNLIAFFVKSHLPVRQKALDESFIFEVHSNCLRKWHTISTFMPLESEISALKMLENFFNHGMWWGHLGQVLVAILRNFLCNYPFKRKLEYFMTTFVSFFFPL
jgi:hypothetical protein